VYNMSFRVSNIKSAAPPSPSTSIVYSREQIHRRFSLSTATAGYVSAWVFGI
jgi:hypothetical protein